MTEIDETFGDADFYSTTGPEEVARLQKERDRLSGVIEDLMGEWEQLEAKLAG